MRARLRSAPPASGKTFRCLADIRAVLRDCRRRPPLPVLIAPKQTTYQTRSRKLLAVPSLPGYTRLPILSFERLASFVFKELRKPPPRMLSDEGRVMVLRALLAKKRDSLKLFRASARLTGFAQHLSEALRELQRQQLTPESLLDLAEQTQGLEGLSLKLQDLATLLRDYLDWLRAHELQDADRLLHFAANPSFSPSTAVTRWHLGGRLRGIFPARAGLAPRTPASRPAVHDYILSRQSADGKSVVAFKLVHGRKRVSQVPQKSFGTSWLPVEP